MDGAVRIGVRVRVWDEGKKRKKREKREKRERRWSFVTRLSARSFLFLVLLLLEG